LAKKASLSERRAARKAYEQAKQSRGGSGGPNVEKVWQKRRGGFD